MASSHSWQAEGKKVEAVTDFLSWAPKITADGDCNHEIKRRLLLRRKAMTNLDSTLKSRDITLLTKVCLVKAMGFFRRKSTLNIHWKDLMLKLQCFGHLMWRADSLVKKTLILGKIESRGRRGQERMRWLDGITDSMDMSLKKTLGDSEGQESLACCSPWGHKESDTS